MVMKVRPATNRDAPFVRDLVFSALDEFGLRDCHEGCDQDLDDLEASYPARGGFFDVLVNENDQVVGSVGVFPRGDATCELRKMYLRPQFRGQGHGKMLLDHAIQKARSLGFTRMELETSSRLTRAIELYRRNGFEPFHPSAMIPRCDQAWVRAI